MSSGTYASGFIDTALNTEFFHYVSIDKIPITVDKAQRIDNNQDPKSHKMDGKIAFKHQTIVELVPFFLGMSEPHRLALAANFMRSTPAWKQRNILLPYPLHLATQVMSDMKDVIYTL